LCIELEQALVFFSLCFLLQLRLALATIINDLFAREPQLIATKPLYSYDPAAHAFPEALVSLSTTSALPSAMSFTPSLHAQAIALSAGAQAETALCSRHLRAACGICPEAAFATPAPAAAVVDDTKGSSSAIPTAARRITVLRPRAGAVAPGTHLVRRQTREKSKVKSDTGLPSLVFMPSGNTPLVDLLPRFLRLSALAAVELATEEMESAAASVTDNQSTYGSDSAGEGILGQGGGGGGGGGGTAGLGDVIPWSPTKEWFLLLAGLATRAIVEGYTVGGWQGFQPAQTVFSIGTRRAIGVADPSLADDQVDQPGEFAWFEPDELPGLKEAVRTLFPDYDGGDGSAARRIFHEQMQERLRSVSNPLSSCFPRGRRSY
jgi:hypothetical protein